MTDVTDGNPNERRVNVRRVDDHGRPVYTRGPLIRILLLTSAVATLAAVVALIVSLTSQQNALDRFNEGREFAVGATCAVESAVAQAGYAVITRAMPESPFARFLEQHGYPPPRARALQAAEAGQQYVQQLAREVASRVGPKGARLILPDGSLDCVRLARLAGTEPLRR